MRLLRAGRWARFKGRCGVAWRRIKAEFWAEWPLTKPRLLVIVLCLIFQYVHAIFTLLAYHLHKPLPEPLHDIGFEVSRTGGTAGAGEECGGHCGEEMSRWGLQLGMASRSCTTSLRWALHDERLLQMKGLLLSALATCRFSRSWGRATRRCQRHLCTQVEEQYRRHCTQALESSPATTPVHCLPSSLLSYAHVSKQDTSAQMCRLRHVCGLAAEPLCHAAQELPLGGGVQACAGHHRDLPNTAHHHIPQHPGVFLRMQGLAGVVANDSGVFG